MLAELKHTLRRLRGQMIGWGVGLALYSLMMAFFYAEMGGMGDLQAFVENYPEEMKAFFKGMAELGTPRGYLDTYYYSMMSLIVGIFAVGAGAGLVAGEEEKGTLDLVMAHPVSRTALFWGRVLGLAVATAVILLGGWLGWLAPSDMRLSWLQLLWPCLPLFGVLAFFGALSLLLSLLLPASRMGSMLSGALLVGNYLVLGLANINADLQPVVKLTPLYYYQGGYAVDGVNWAWLGGLLGAAFVLALGAWALFQRRDIRVGGEHGWRLAGPARRRT
ncbi:MAG: ABC transporter permease subunit [Anaerolineae bacterium]|nr:ABC transporter permease subunit [Anaerolineae bacterium]